MLKHLPTELTQQFLDSLPAALALVDKNNEIIWVNDSFMRVTTLSEKQVVGKTLTSLDADVQEMFKDGHTYLNATNKRDYLP